MIFEETRLKGAFIIRPEKKEDERGFFTRSFCVNELADHGLNARVVQCNISYNRKKGTFRGMHFQTVPYEEDKLVSCISGGIRDYIIDLREDSPTFREWVSVELTADNLETLYVPKSFAHGFITLTDHARVFYQMTEFYHPECAHGIRWDDRAFGIEIPFPITSISERDRGYQDFRVEEYRALTKGRASSVARLV